METTEQAISLSDRSILEAMRASRGTDGLADFLRDLRRVDGPPLMLEERDLDHQMAAIVVAYLGDNPSAMKGEERALLSDRVDDRVYVEGLLRAQEANLVAAASGLVGEFTTKVPNPAVGGVGSFFACSEVVDATKKVPFATSMTIDCRRGLGAAGNAAAGRAMRLLTARFSIAGCAVDLVDDITAATGFGPITAALNRLGLSLEVIERIRDELLEAKTGPAEAAPVDEYAKVLLWPVGDDMYHQITPVHSYGLFVEMHARIKERRAAGGWINLRRTIVGGSKPQNAGLLNSEFAGNHLHLLAQPPTIQRPGSTTSLAYRVAHGGRVLREKLPAPLLQKLTETLDDARANRDARERLDRVIQAVAGEILADAVLLRRAADQDAIPKVLIKAEKDLRSLERNLLFMSPRALASEDLNAIVHAVSTNLAASIPSHFVDDALAVRIRKVVHELVSGL